MQKRASLFIIILMMYILISNNSTLMPNKVEINMLELTQVIGLDNSPQNGLVTFTIARNKTNNQESQGSSESSSNEASSNMEQQNTISVESDTFSNANSMLQSLLNKQFPGSHLKYFVIGEEAAKEDLSKYIDFILRNKEIRLNGKIFIAKGKSAKNIIQVGNNKDSKIQDKLQNIVENMYETGIYNNCTISDVLKILNKDRQNGVVPTLDIIRVDEVSDRGWKIEKEKQQLSESDDKKEENLTLKNGEDNGNEGSEEDNQQNSSSNGEDENNSDKIENIMLDGYAVIKDGKVVEYLSPSTSRGYNFFKDLIKTTNISVYDKENQLVNLDVVQSNSKVDFKFDDDKLEKIYVKIEISSDINEAHTSDKLIEKMNIDFIEEKESQIVKEEVENLFAKVKSIGADFVDLEDILKMKHPYKWRKIENDWEKILNDVEIEVEVSSKIKRTFDILDSDKGGL